MCIIYNAFDESHKGWCFIRISPDQCATLRPLLSTWVDISINALMTMAPNPERRQWFVIDELPALQRLPSLETALAESRKYGGCVLAGIQSMPQLNTVYGQSVSRSLLDLFNTKIFSETMIPILFSGFHVLWEKLKLKNCRKVCHMVPIQ